MVIISNIKKGITEMARNIDITFNSEKNEEKSYQLASGHISTTSILFENENLVAVVEASGDVAFYNMEDELIAKASVPAVEGGRKVYEEIVCCAENGKILLKFPICEWIDHYPNCDGEHDRWSTKTVGFHTLILDTATYSVICE